MLLAGGILSMTGAIFATLAALGSAAANTIGTTPEATPDTEQVLAAWGLVLLTLATLVAALLSLRAQNPWIGTGISAVSLACIMAGGFIVSAFMFMPLVGGMLSAVGAYRGQLNKANRQ